MGSSSVPQDAAGASLPWRMNPSRGHYHRAQDPLEALEVGVGNQLRGGIELRAELGRFSTLLL